MPSGHDSWVPIPVRLTGLTCCLTFKRMWPVLLQHRQNNAFGPLSSGVAKTTKLDRYQRKCVVVAGYRPC
jgi:hypothetical protein